MKINFNLFVLALSLTFFSCNKNEVSLNENSSITSGGLVSGTIVNFIPAMVDSVKVYDNSLYIGKSSVTTEGKFSMSLSTPTLRRIGKGPNGVVVSDTTALIGNSKFKVYKMGIVIGDLVKCNYTTPDSANTVGATISEFIYCDREFTIKGTENVSDTAGTYVYNTTTICNIVLKKGWNEVVMKVSSYSKTSTGVTSVLSLINSIPSDLKWRHFNIDPYYVKSKVKGQQQMKMGELLFK